MTIHATRCTWNAIACAAENMRDVFNQWDGALTINNAIVTARGYQDDYLVTCDVDCVDRIVVITNTDGMIVEFQFNSAEWTDSGALYNVLCENDPGNNYTVQFHDADAYLTLKRNAELRRELKEINAHLGRINRQLRGCVGTLVETKMRPIIDQLTTRRTELLTQLGIQDERSRLTR